MQHTNWTCTSCWLLMLLQSLLSVTTLSYRPFLPPLYSAAAAKLLLPLPLLLLLPLPLLLLPSLLFKREHTCAHSDKQYCLLLKPSLNTMISLRMLIGPKPGAPAVSATWVGDQCMQEEVTDDSSRCMLPDCLCSAPGC